MHVGGLEELLSMKAHVPKVASIELSAGISAAESIALVRDSIDRRYVLPA